MIPEGQEPDLKGLDSYIYAFRELSSCRQVGFGAAPIPFTAILQYCNLYNIEDVEEFSYLIRCMDNALLALESKKDKKNASKHNSKNNNKS